MEANSEEVQAMAIIRIKPELTESARPVVEGFIEPTRKEKGCLRYDWYKDGKDQGTYVVLERFANMQAFQSHLTSQYAQDGVAQLNKLQRQPLEGFLLIPQYVAKK